METMTAFKNEAKKKLRTVKAWQRKLEKRRNWRAKIGKVVTMLHSMEEKLKKAELDKSQQIGSLTENIGVHTQQLNKELKSAIDCEGFGNG